MPVQFPLLITLFFSTLCTFALSACAEEENLPPTMEEVALSNSKQQRLETGRSQALAQQLSQTDPITEVIWLGSGDDEYLGLYRPDKSGQSFANLLILHDNIQNPDWPGLVHELRVQLSEFGWSTLSIAVPDYRPPNRQHKEAKIEESPTPETAPIEPETVQTEYPADQIPDILTQRLQDAITFLKEKNPQPIAIVALGSSATLVAKQAQSLLLQNLNGLVMIDPTPLVHLQGFDTALDVMELRVPILDIAPEFNPKSDPALRSRNASQRQHPSYRTRIMRGANQDFAGHEAQTIKALRGWGEGLFKPQ